MLNERTYIERIYNVWAAKDLWTVEEAIKLIIGHDPEFKLSGQHCRDELYLGQFENGFDEIAEQRGEKYHKIEELLRRALQAGSITTISQPSDSGAFSSYNNEFDDEGIRVESEWASQVCVAPKVFIEWVKQKRIEAPKEMLAALDNSITGTGDLPEYVSPYIQLMLKASKELQITEDSAPTHEALKKWLSDNWPSDLIVSENLLKMMATLTRSEKHAKGGNKKRAK
jgi:hypothetical protein